MNGEYSILLPQFKLRMLCANREQVKNQGDNL